MAINLSDNLAILTNAPADVRYGPHTGATESAAISTANTAVPSGVRYEGLTVGLIIAGAAIVEYWYNGGIADGDLAEKSSGATGGAITIKQTGSTISTAVQQVDVNQPAGSGLIAQAKNMTGTLVPTTGITVDFSTNPQGIFTGLATTVSPAGGQGGSASGATLSVTVKNGDVVSVRIDAAGTGYTAGDVLTVLASSIGTGGTTNTSITLVAADIYDGSLAPVSTTLNTIYDTQLSPTQQSVAVGGVALDTPVSSFSGDSIVDVLNKILFPTQTPVYRGPTAALTDTVNVTVEIGSDVSNNLTLRLDKRDSGGLNTTGNSITSSLSGSLSLTGPTTTSITNLSDQFGFSNSNNPNQRFTYTANDSFSMPSSGSVTYTSIIKYLAGNQLLDSTGNPSGTAIAAGQLTPGNSGVSGIYPYFWGLNTSMTQVYATAVSEAKGFIQAGTANKVLASSTGTLTITFNATAGVNYMFFATPATSTTKTKWDDPNNPLNNGGIAGTSFTATVRELFSAPSTQSITSPDQNAATDPLWSNVSYKVYVALKSSDSVTLRLKNN
jgi:hypothetical protein